MLRVMGFAARYVLGTGKMNLAGRPPNGQEFIVNPQQVWLVKLSGAVGPDGLSPGEELPAQFLVGDRLRQMVLDLPTASQEVIPEIALA